MDCGKCSRELHSPRKTVKCTACGVAYHPACTRLKTVDNYKKMKNSLKLSWKCDRCLKSGGSGEQKPGNKVPRDVLGTGEVDDDGDDSDDDGGSEVDEDMASTLNSKLDQVLKKMTSLKYNTEKSLNFNSDKLDEVLNKISTLESTVKSLSSVNDRLVRENRELNARVDDLAARVNRFDQAMIEGEIELSGFPETAGEDPKSIVVKVAGCLDCKMDLSDIEFAYRVKPKPSGNDRMLIVAKFVSLNNKKKVLSSYRVKKGIRVTDILPDSPHKEQRLFFNDRLTLYNKRLLWQAKQVAKEYAYAFVWSREGDILRKKDEQSRPTRILSPQMLQRLDTRKKLTHLFGGVAGEE